jgi:preprotein translocase subunit SecG
MKSKNNKNNMKSKNNKNNMRYNLCYSTMLILVVFIIAYIILSFIYNRKKNTLTSNVKSNSGNDILHKLKSIDRFADIMLNELPMLKNNIPNDNLSTNEKLKIFYYNNLLNETTTNAMNEFINDEGINTTNQNNITVMLNNYNAINNRLNDILQDLNGQLLSQLQKNYSTAHKLNIERNIDNENIDYLPQRFN